MTPSEMLLGDIITWILLGVVSPALLVWSIYREVKGKKKVGKNLFARERIISTRRIYGFSRKTLL